MGERAEKCGYPSKRWHGFTCSRNATVNAADGRRVCRTHRDIIDRNIASQRPTVLTMDGESTSTGDTRAADVLDDPPEFLDAPTPRVTAAAAGSPGPAKP